MEERTVMTFLKYSIGVCVWVFAVGTGTQAAQTPAGGSYHPQTGKAVVRPTTQVVVRKPETATTVKQLKTETVANHPQTTVSVNHPTTPGSPNTEGTSSAGNSAATSTKKEANTIPSSSSATSMSGFQMPKAKDLKAANLTAGEAGLGKPDDAEKNAAAASFKVPKAENASAENLQSVVQKAESLNKSTLEKQLNDKTSK